MPFGFNVGPIRAELSHGIIHRHVGKPWLLEDALLSFAGQQHPPSGARGCIRANYSTHHSRCFTDSKRVLTEDGSELATYGGHSNRSLGKVWPLYQAGKAHRLGLPVTMVNTEACESPQLLGLLRLLRRQRLRGLMAVCNLIFYILQEGL